MKNKIVFLLLALISIVLIGCKDDPVMTDFNALGAWADGGDAVYTLTTNTDKKLAFSYDKGDHPLAYLTKDISEDLSGMKSLVITAKGVGSMRVQLIAGTETKEVSLNVTSLEGSYEWSLLNAGEFLKKVTAIRIIGAPEKEGVTGNIEISELKFYNTDADNFIIQTDFNNIPDNINEYNGTAVNFNFNSKWERFVSTEEVYNITVDGTVTKVTVEKSTGAEWACIQALVKGEFSKFDYVVAKVKGNVGQNLMLKAANGYENQITLNGNEQYVAVDISAMTANDKNAINAIFFFGYAGKASGTGNFEIIEAYMTEEFDTGIEKNVYDGVSETFSINYWYDGGEGVYTITNDNETVINYVKGKDSSTFAAAKAYLEGDISGFGKIVIEVTGEAGKKAMFKIEGGGQNVEKEVLFDGSKQKVELIISNLATIALKAVKEVIVFAAPGEVEVSGSFTIHSYTFSADVENVNSNWVDGGDGVYTFVENSNGTLTVNYNKAAEKGWASMKRLFGEEYSRFNTLTLVLRGAAGKQLLIKPNDDGALEKTVTFEEGEDLVFTATAESLTQ
ncbi:MAG: hypothetical protein PHX62_05415, partial [Bacilli bacterium]|nr:hypothetical protein [Bacilli bacterium]